jgi:hypothetical protein
MEDTIAMLPVNIPGGQTWRSNLEPPMTSMPSDIEGRQQDKWDHLSKKVISTRVFGREFVELFEILASHQREAGRVSGKEVRFHLQTSPHYSDSFFSIPYSTLSQPHFLTAWTYTTVL